jgi:hypothetical protein
MWQLCFNHNIGTDILNTEQTLMHSIRLLLREHPHYLESKRLLATVNNFLFYLKVEYRADLVEYKSQGLLNLNHVIISYHRDQRDLYLKLKCELERQNFRVWSYIDANLNLEKSFHAIESSLHVLILMSERYKKSNKCRAEAEHAYSLHKHVIPIVASSGYIPDGWLSKSIGNSMSINYADFNFDDGLRAIIEEIGMRSKLYGDDLPLLINMHNNLYMRKTNPVHPIIFPERNVVSVVEVPPDVEHSLSATSYSLTRRLPWSEAEVRRWANEKNFNPTLLSCIMPCDGIVLEQYYMMLKNVPEFFYSSLSANGPVKLRDSAVFVAELKRLFE